MLLSTVLTFEQANISPAKPQSNPVVISGATIHVGNGQVINNGYIAFNKGKITAITEKGDLNPHVRSLIAFNTDSKVIPTVRSNGILLAQPTPEDGTISRQSSLMMLDGWNWEDAAYKKDIGIHLTWPVATASRGRRGGFALTFLAGQTQETPAERAQKAIDDINSLFTQAQGYAAEPRHAVTNIRFEAMQGLFNGSKNCLSMPMVQKRLNRQ